jgi:hypothetical protein
LKHFALMVIFSIAVAVVFAAASREGESGRFRYGLKIFIEFVGVGFVLAWILYYIP